MTDPVYTDEQLDDTRKFFRDAAQGKHGSFIPVKDRAGQVADMLDDLAERKAEAKWDGELVWPVAKETRFTAKGMRWETRPPFDFSDYTGEV